MMDILLSLPLLSFFFSSSSTSWSTSLNLLFFYVTWSTLILSHSPLHVQVFGTLAIRLFFFLLPSLLFLLFDTLLPSLAETIKHGGPAALPPRNARTLARVLLLALLNLLLATAVETGATLALSALLGRPPFRTSTTLPLPFAALKQLGCLYAAREVLAYYLHRAVLHSHQPRWWPTRRPWRSSLSAPSDAAKRAAGYLARQHARHAHARDAPPYALALAADHPLPFLLHRVAPVYLPAALVVRPHLLVYFVFVLLVTCEETLAMSGYAVVPGLLMGGIARRTAAHYDAGHCGADSGNYGAWGLLDWMGGTGMGRGRGLEDDVREEASRHRVRERSRRKAGDAVGAVQDGIRGIQGVGKGKGKGRARARKGGSGSD